MKKVLTFMAVFSIVAACNDKAGTETTKDVVGVADSTMYKNNTMADTARVVADTGRFAPEPVEPVVVETKKTEKRVETVKSTKSKVKPKPAPSSVMTPSAGSTDTKAETPATATPDATATTPTPAAEPEKKKGWSSAAKDATIGGVAGAVGGAIISKKKGKGAIIGGVVGAAGGYILGRKKDKKEQAKDTIK